MSRAVNRAYRFKLGLGGALFLGWITVALLPEIFLPQAIPAISLPLQLPGAVSDAGFRHWLGTDSRGNDILLHLVTGARETIFSAFFILLFSYLITAVIVAPFVLGATLSAGVIRESFEALLHYGRVLPTLLVYVVFLTGTGVPVLSAAAAVAFGSATSIHGLIENAIKLKLKAERTLRRIVLQHAVIEFFDRCFVTMVLLLTLEFLSLWIPTGWGFYLTENRLMMPAFPHVGLPYLLAIISLLIGINLLRVEFQKRLFNDESEFFCAELNLAGDRIKTDKKVQIPASSDAVE